MANNPKLFTVTQWMLRLGVGFCLFGVFILGCCLAAMVVMGSGLWVPKEIPEMTEGVSRTYILLLCALAFAAGLALLTLCILIFRTIDQIVGSAIGGDPFIIANADRLAQVGWLLVGVHGVQFMMGVLMGLLLPKQLEDNFKFDGITDISPLGVLAVLLVFVLAQIFRRGAEMRAELEGTV